MKVRTAAYAGIFLWGLRKILRKVSVARTHATTVYDYINSNEFHEAYARNLQLYKDNIERIKREQYERYPITEEERYGTLDKSTGCSIRYYTTSDGKANYCEMPNAYQGIHSIQVQCIIQKSRLVR